HARRVSRASQWQLYSRMLVHWWLRVSGHDHEPVHYGAVRRFRLPDRRGTKRDRVRPTVGGTLRADVRVHQRVVSRRRWVELDPVSCHVDRATGTAARLRNARVRGRVLTRAATNARACGCTTAIVKRVKLDVR